MARPLLPLRVDQLEGMFAKGKADPEALRQLEHELQFRKAPRAITLLEEVQAALRGGNRTSQSLGVPNPPAARAPSPDSQQLKLWGHMASTTPVATPVNVNNTGIKSSEIPPVSSQSAPPTLMQLDDAYKILKVSPGAKWESVEQKRRILVQQSYPLRMKSLSAEKRTQALAEAKRVNAAYAALSQARCAGR